MAVWRLTIMSRERYRSLEFLSLSHVTVLPADVNRRDLGHGGSLLVHDSDAHRDTA